MILKESIRYDDPLLKLFRGNKKILVQDIHDEADDFRFWAGFLAKLGTPEEEIEKIFSQARCADSVPAPSSSMKNRVPLSAVSSRCFILSRCEL